MRNFLAVLAGLAAAIVIFLLAESLNGVMHPMPANVNPKDPTALKAFYLNRPLSLWLLVLAGWFSGSFLCGLLIRLISRHARRTLPLIAGGILTLSAIANFLSLPHPAWFIILGLLVFLPATLLGHAIYRREV